MGGQRGVVLFWRTATPAPRPITRTLASAAHKTRRLRQKSNTTFPFERCSLRRNFSRGHLFEMGDKNMTGQRRFGIRGLSKSRMLPAVAGATLLLGALPGPLQ